MTDIISSITQIFGCFKDCCYQSCNYVVSYDVTIDSLTREVNELKGKREDIERQVQAAKRDGLDPMREVLKWLESAEDLENEAQKVRSKFSGMFKCFCSFPVNLCSSFPLRTRAEAALAKADALKQQAAEFSGAVADNLDFTRFVEMPCPRTTGADEVLGELEGHAKDDGTSKNQSGRKRKQPVSSSGPANSSGTANTAGPSPGSAPSTPSTHTPGDVMSMPSLQHSASSTKPLIFGSDGAGSLTSPSNQLADIDRFVEDGSLDDNIESFLSHDDTDARDTVGCGMDVSKGFTFAEMRSTRASTSKVVCCHFSSDGKLLATGGHDKKAVLWYSDTLKPKSTLEEHTLLITDVRFSPSIARLATSSFDKTVRVWDADNPGYSLRTFTGHSASVMSLDFHPNKDDLICSCDGDGEIRYWSIKNGSYVRVFKGGTTQMRFQPRMGRYLAAAAENIVSILDVETQTCLHQLQGHAKHVDSVCWDSSGKLLVSVSEDSVRVWSFSSGSEGECMHELSCNGNKFHSCVFHPTYQSLLVIGCYQSLELWDMNESKTMTLPAHEGLIAALAVSNVNGLVASVSHDKYVKLWK